MNWFVHQVGNLCLVEIPSGHYFRSLWSVSNSHTRWRKLFTVWSLVWACALRLQWNGFLQLVSILRVRQVATQRNPSVCVRWHFQTCDSVWSGPYSNESGLFLVTRWRCMVHTTEYKYTSVFVCLILTKDTELFTVLWNHSSFTVISKKSQKPPRILNIQSYLSNKRLVSNKRPP